MIEFYWIADPTNPIELGTFIVSEPFAAKVINNSFFLSIKKTEALSHFIDSHVSLTIFYKASANSICLFILTEEIINFFN